jgi:hypothetical protein
LFTKIDTRCGHLTIRCLSTYLHNTQLVQLAADAGLLPLDALDLALGQALSVAALDLAGIAWEKREVGKRERETKD